MNTDAQWPTLEEAKAKVLGMQTKLHRWAMDSPDRSFDDLFNLVYDPAFLMVAWDRVRGNRGARSAGIDGIVPRSIDNSEQRFLIGLRADLKARSFQPVPVKQRKIPKANGKLRALGIPTAADRCVQASLKLVLEPIFEADFHPCSYGFRPNRRPHDAIAEIHMFATQGYERVLDADIEACFDRIDHVALLDRLRRRVKDKRICELVKAFLHAGVLGEDQRVEKTNTGTPQGGILSPLLANIALSALDDHFVERWNDEMATRADRARRKRNGLPNWRLVRYADDLVAMVAGTEAHVEALRDDITAVLAPMGLRLSAAKTRICHIDEGFSFLGFRIQRQRQRGSKKQYVYTWPSKDALASAKAKVRTISNQTPNQTLTDLLRQINGVLRGWTNYFRHGVSSDTFGYLRHFTWRRVICWLRRKYRKANWKWLRRHYAPVGFWPVEDETALFDPMKVPVTRYRYRGASIPSRWAEQDQQSVVTTA